MESTRENGFFLIPNFENYAIDTKKVRVVNLKTNKEVVALKTSGVKKFKLFKNGQPHLVTLFEIFRSVIECYFHPKKKLS